MISHCNCAPPQCLQYIGKNRNIDYMLSKPYTYIVPALTFTLRYSFGHFFFIVFSNQLTHKVFLSFSSSFSVSKTESYQTLPTPFYSASFQVQQIICLTFFTYRHPYFPLVLPSSQFRVYLSPHTNLANWPASTYLPGSSLACMLKMIFSVCDLYLKPFCNSPL